MDWGWAAQALRPRRQCRLGSGIVDHGGVASDPELKWKIPTLCLHGMAARASIALGSAIPICRLSYRRALGEKYL